MGESQYHYLRRIAKQKRQEGIPESLRRGGIGLLVGRRLIHMLPVKKWSEKPILKDAGTRPNHSKMDTGSVVYAMDQCHLGCFYGWSAFYSPGEWER